MKSIILVFVYGMMVCRFGYEQNATFQLFANGYFYCFIIISTPSPTREI